MTITIAVLCPGPSLPDLWDDCMAKNYHTVIGVNSAAWFFHVDILAYLDPKIWQKWPADRKTPRKLITGLRVERPDWDYELIESDLFSVKSKEALPRGLMRESATINCVYTLPHALCVAKKMAGVEGAVDVFGMDIALGQNDFLGEGGDRSGERFRRELPWIKYCWEPHWVIFGSCPDPVRAWLASQGDENFAWAALR